MNKKIIPTATLDTNVLQEYWRDQPKAHDVRRLLDLSDSGKLDLAVTSRIRSDVPHPPLAERINELPIIGVKMIPSLARLGHSRLDGTAYLSDGKIIRVLEEIVSRFRETGMKEENLPDFRDLDHLEAHKTSKRDVFLTWDTGILHIAECLDHKLGIVVVKPEDYLEKE